jgi:hypothetical protein
MIEIWGTVEQLTAETSWAPILMMPLCSALAPTMKPVTLWRNIIGVFLSSLVCGVAMQCAWLTVDCKDE